MEISISEVYKPNLKSQICCSVFFLRFSPHGCNGGHAPSHHQNRPNGQGGELGDSLSFIPVALALVVAFLMGGLGEVTGAMIAGARR